MDDARFTAGILSLIDASRFLEVPRQTFHRWARGYERGEPLLHVLEVQGRRQAAVTFIALAEAHVLNALRDAGVRPHRIRPALQVLQKEFGRDYVLTAPELATDGIDVLWDFSRTRDGSGLIEGHTGQGVMREIVQDYMQYVSWDADGFPDRLTFRRCEPSKVVSEVDHVFGQPRFAGSRVRVSDVAAMLSAGENPEVVADEFGVSQTDVRTAARVLLGRAA
ncbi:MAG TPA: DUF433 domain-containing protein [Nocardioidaceae bacterium]|nr:DUF433 domain-containing protein [Nocardioidaceae bacterium]